MEVDEVFKRAREALPERLASLPLEQIRFPERGEVTPKNPGSVKEPAARALAPLSYAPMPATGVRGALVFGKSVDGGELRITIDTGTWSHHFHARFEIRSEQWIRSMAIPLSATFPQGHYQQIDREHIDRLCTNLALVVREIEAHVYPAVAQALQTINAS